MQTIMQRLGQLGEALGPYLLVELLLPGGSLIALSLWLYRRYGSTAQRSATVTSEIRATPREIAG
jgi:hypothetical protein